MLLNSGEYTAVKLDTIPYYKQENMLTNNLPEIPVFNNYIVGFTIDKTSGNNGDQVYAYYPNCDFMANYIPFETAGGGYADEWSY